MKNPKPKVKAAGNFSPETESDVKHLQNHAEYAILKYV